MVRHHDPPIRQSVVVVLLSSVIVVLSALAATAGLADRGTERTFDHVTARGEAVEMYGQGLYRYDSTFQAGANQGSDALVLLFGVPILLISTILYRRGSTHAGLVLLGVLFFFTYVYGTYSLGIAFNNLFLVYVALFGASLYAFLILFVSIDLQAIRARFSSQMPRRLPAAFMFAVALVATAIWLQAPLGSILTGNIELVGSTTLITHALDLAIIVPAAALSGYFILQRQPIGYLIAFSLLILVASLLPLMTLQTMFQLAAGVTIPGEAIIGVFAGFIALSIGAMWVLVSLLRNITSSSGDAERV